MDFWISRKKISSFITKYSSSNEREKRAYEQLEERRSEGSSFLSDKIREATEEFKYGDLTFLYYRFLEKFHCEPKTWGELFECLDFVEIESKINKIISDFNSKE